jgi:hypothetical protein
MKAPEGVALPPSRPVATKTTPKPEPDMADCCHCKKQFDLTRLPAEVYIYHIKNCIEAHILALRRADLVKFADKTYRQHSPLITPSLKAKRETSRQKAARLRQTNILRSLGRS